MQIFTDNKGLAQADDVSNLFDKTAIFKPLAKAEAGDENRPTGGNKLI